MRVTLGLGSNLGDRLANLQSAVDALAGHGPVTVSPVMETAAVGGPEQPDYLNAVVTVELPEDTDLWELVDGIEQSRGRTRSVRFGPRTLDVDVLDAGRIGEDPAMTLPHPRAHLRAFVLLPWAALDPTAELTGHGPVGELAAGLPQAESDGVRPRPDLRLVVPDQP